MAASQGSDLAQSAVDVGQIKFIASEVRGDNKAMMQTLDTLRSQLGEAVIVLAQVQNDKVGMVVGVSKELAKQLPAPEVMAAASPLVGAKGGGRPDLARAGGGDKPDGLSAAFEAAQDYVRAQLG